MKPSRTTLPLFVLALTACAGAGEGTPVDGSKPAGSAGPVTEQQRIVQAGHFDLGTLFPSPPVVPARINKQVLGGVELAARPFVLECLVDPRNRGADKRTKVAVDATLGDAGVDHQVAGQNLTPAGITCVKGALAKFTASIPGLDAKHAEDKAITVHVETDHVVGENPSVVLGTNEASDIVGTIRLALPTLSDCLADWKSQAPRTLKAKVVVVRPKTGASTTVAPAEVTFEATSDPGADKVAACLKGKLMALPVPTPKGESITLPNRFSFVHSGIDGMGLPGAEPALSLEQIELVRARREVERVIAQGDRDGAFVVYNASVDAYKAAGKDPKAPKVTVDELTTRCNALVAADDRLIDVFKKVTEGEATAHRFTLEQKEKDAAWAPIEALAKKQLDEAQKAVETMKNNRKLDEAACPKIRL